MLKQPYQALHGKHVMLIKRLLVLLSTFLKPYPYLLDSNAVCMTDPAKHVLLNIRMSVL